MNNVVLIGRLTRDPELRYLPAGTPVCKFSLAIDKNLSRDKKQEMESKGQPTADFINIVVWRKMGENCANYLAKGRQVAIQGRIQSGSYLKDDGTRVYTTDVVATNVEFLGGGDNNKKQNEDSSDIDYNNIPGFYPTDDNDDIPF